MNKSIFTHLTNKLKNKFLTTNSHSVNIETLVVLVFTESGLATATCDVPLRVGPNSRGSRGSP